MIIRHAVADDLPGILSIYNHAVEHTTAIWNETLVDLANRQQWLSERNAAGFPVLVAVDAFNHVLGYASYGTWRSIEGFRHSVEHSVYVSAEHYGMGIGKALLGALIDYAKTQKVHVMVAAIESDNSTSIALHQRFGFITTGQMPQVGRKFSRWLDLTFMQLIVE